MSKKIYVKNLPYQANQDDLFQHFSSCGQVISAKVLYERGTTRSRGCGFVEMSTEEQAKQAIATLSGKLFMGRAIFAEEARENNSPRPQSIQPNYSSYNLPQPEMTHHSGEWVHVNYDDQPRRRRRVENKRKDRFED